MASANSVAASSKGDIANICCHGIRRYPRQIPVTRLGRLAVHSNLQGQGLGRLLLADAVTRSRNAALSVGSTGIFVDAKSADAVRFYKHYGFIACHDQPYKLYLPMWPTVRLK